MRVGPLLAGWALLAGLAGYTHADNDPLGLGEVYAAMNYDGVHTTVSWTDCGQVNAFYVPGIQHVFLCNELRTQPRSFVRFVYAHELAHGVIAQRDIPITGSGEVAADELAAYTMIGAGWADDVFAAGRTFMESGQPEDPVDPHPSDAHRAFSLGCFALQSKGLDSDYCRGTPWPQVTRNWARLLGVGEFAPK